MTMKTDKRWSWLSLALLFSGSARMQAQTNAPSAGATSAQAGSPADASIQAEVMKALDNKRFQDVKVAVANGIVTLTGSVGVYAEKEDADKKTHHRKNVKGVRTISRWQGLS